MPTRPGSMVPERITSCPRVPVCSFARLPNPTGNIVSCANLGCSHGTLDTLVWLFFKKIRRSVWSRGVLRMQHAFVIGLEAAVA